MSQTLLRGLRLLETVDFHGAMTISQLARELGVDKATASRMVSACETDGWLVRVANRVSIGPRSAMLGQGAAAGESLRAAEPLVHAVCGVTGMLTQAVGLVGSQCVVLASASSGSVTLPYGLTTRFPLWLSAVGKTVASQLDPHQLDNLLPADPFPPATEAIAGVAPPEVVDRFLAAVGLAAGVSTLASSDAAPGSTRVSTRAELDIQLEGIRADELFIDRNELFEGTSCIAVPWPRAGLPAALVCITTAAGFAGQGRVAERALRAASRSGATRESIVRAAAG